MDQPCLRDDLCHESCSRRHPYDRLCSQSTERSRVVSIATHGLCLSDVTADCVSTLEFVCEKYRSFSGISDISFADMGSVLLKHLRARCSEAVKRVLMRTLRISASAKLECTAMSAERLNKGGEHPTLLKRRLHTEKS